MASRQHARVRLRLPVRLRWIAPLGQQSEICETRNASRGGLLVACKEPHNEGFPLWVTFPFDAAAPEQPEVLARVMRSRHAADQNGGHEEIALHFESVPMVARPNLDKPASKVAERPAERPPEKPVDSGDQKVGEKAAAEIHEKNSVLRRVVLPIRVRPENIPWFEEAMTTEISTDEIRFVSHREYLENDTLFVTFVGKDTKPWMGNGEITAKIVKIEIIPKAAALLVTIRRI